MRRFYGYVPPIGYSGSRGDSYGHGEGELLPYIDYTGMCRPTRYAASRNYSHGPGGAVVLRYIGFDFKLSPKNGLSGFAS